MKSQLRSNANNYTNSNINVFLHEDSLSGNVQDIGTTTAAPIANNNDQVLIGTIYTMRNALGETDKINLLM